jgi:hypothetical protein
MVGSSPTLHRPWSARALGLCFLLGILSLAPDALAQVLVVSPDCGIAGTTSVRIKGSGWAEPQPLCEYIFYWDGAEVIGPRQPDGLYGPPNHTFTVPAGAAVGNHVVKVELRYTGGGGLIQCRQTNFRVVAMINNPWAMGMTITNGGRRMDVRFDPNGVCDVTPCTRIELIQVIRQVGRRADGTERNLSYAERGFPNAAQRDSDKTAAGYVVDEPWGGRDPYATGMDPSDMLPGFMPGVQGPMPMPATFNDPPGLSDAGFPADIQRVIYRFEVNTFCSAGDDRGSYFGMVTWTWERPRGGAVTITAGASNRNQPTQEFLDAVALWNTRHGFRMPTAQPPTRGGEPCR